MRPFLLALLLVGCAGASSSAVRGPDGGDWYAVKCRRSHANCLEEAGEVCPQGYVTSERAGSEGFAMYSSGSTLVAGSTFRGYMMIRCR